VRVIVTGGAGFIGSHIVDRLLKDGHTVKVVDNLSATDGSTRNIDHVLPKIEFARADIRDLDVLKREFRDWDAILHQAGLRSVPASVDDPVPYYEVNVTGHHNVLEAARLNGIKRVVFASSSSVYGDHPDQPQKEGREGVRLSPYAITKHMGEDINRYFWRQYGLETVNLRYFNVFGPRQDPTSQYAAAIAIFSLLMSQGKQPTVYGDGEQTRDFTHVDNVAEGNILAMTAHKSKAAGETINLANGDTISVNRLIHGINQILGKDVRPTYAPARQGDIMHTRADNTKAKELLGYKPVTPFDDGLRKTVEWFRRP
jgi:nucleoside-diphosphate-sugar epimerase